MKALLNISIYSRFNAGSNQRITQENVIVPCRGEVSVPAVHLTVTLTKCHKSSPKFDPFFKLMQMKATEIRSRVSLLNTEKVPQTGNEDETSETAIRPSTESKVNAATGKLNNLFKLKVFPQP